MKEIVEIPWKNFTEEEIQTMISILFHSLDYHIKELHKSDRANEDGADIIVSNKNETFAIAVKLKPNHKDRYQLLELSRRKEKRKIYIFIETPTKKFSETMKQDGNNVEFWDVKHLNNFFIKRNLYFSANLIFHGTETYKNIQEIQYLFFDLLRKCKDRQKDDVKELNKKSFSLLWRLKDISVTLNKTNRLLKNMFEEPMELKDEKFNIYFLNIFLNYLESLNPIASPFSRCFNEFYKNNKQLVDNSIIENSDRSHWLYLYEFKPLNSGYNLKSSLHNGIKEKEAFDRILKKGKSKDTDFEKYCEEISKSNDVWKAIGSQLNELTRVGWAIEAVVDDIIEEYFNDYNFVHLFDDAVEIDEFIYQSFNKNLHKS